MAENKRREHETVVREYDDERHRQMQRARMFRVS
jgi:hypothetical protein